MALGFFLIFPASAGARSFLFDPPDEQKSQTDASDAADGPLFEPVDFDPPVRVKFKLADGVRIDGEMSRFEADRFDGTFGRRRWLDLDPDDIWTVYVHVMDRENAAQWANLGRLLLIIDGEERSAERALRRAVRIDPQAEALVQQARDMAAEARRVAEERQKAIETERLRTDSPEARDWSAQPWPERSAQEQADAVKTMKSDAAGILEKAGLDIQPIETKYFLFYADLPRMEAARWARELDKMYAKLADVFALEEGHNIFWGKAVIFVFSDVDRFRLVEAEAFGQLTPRWVAGLCHPIGPKVFVNFFRQPDDLQFASVLVHETVHGFMHRYRTPRRLPTWANEGFADYLAATTFRNSPIDEQRRRPALKFIRSGGSVDAVLDMTYDDGTWPGPDSIGYAVGYLLVWLMVEDSPRKFGHWVNAVKDGKNWQRALEEDFGAARANLVDVFTRFFTVND